MTKLSDDFLLDTLLGMVEQEVIAQDEKWGEQSHELVGNNTPHIRALQFEILEKQYEYNAETSKSGRIGWDDILKEEVYELITETNPNKQITEAIQIAAVALQIAASIKRKKDKNAQR